MRTLNKKTLINLIFLSSVLVFGMGYYIYRSEGASVAEQLKQSYRVSASQFTDVLSLSVKVRDIPSIHRLLCNSFLVNHSEFVNVYDASGTVLYSLPANLKVSLKSNCHGEFAQAPIKYNGSDIGSIGYCFDVASQIKVATPVYLIVGLIALVSLLSFLLFALFQHHTLHIRKFLSLIDKIDVNRPVFPGPVDKESYNDKTIRSLYDKMGKLLRALDKAAEENREAQKLVAIAQTTAMLAHDVRRPFSMLKMALDTISSCKNEQQVKEIIPLVIPEVERSMASVNGLIADVMEIGARSEPFLESLSTEVVFRNSVEDALRIRPKTGTKIEFLFCHKHKVQADRVRIARVFLNLIDNALVAAGENGRVWFQTKEVDRDGRQFIEFCIGNDGPIIPPSDIPRLFDAFFTRGKKGGTGLGLTIAEKIVKAHCGEITISSSLEQGTEFKFTLPSADVLEYRFDEEKESLKPDGLRIGAHQ